MNLVFNKWEGEIPIPNLSELNNGDDKTTFPFFFNDSSFNIKICKLEDINKEEKFYFIISKNYSYTFYIRNSEIFLPKEIEYYIKNFDLKVIFLSEHESNKFVDTFLQLLIRKIKKNNWNEQNFYIIDNNSLLYKLKDRFNTKINLFKIDYLIHFFSKKYNSPSLIDIETDKKFIFLCHNRQPHYHRILLLAHLKNLNLLDGDITNWSLTLEHSEYMKYTQQASNVISIAPFKNYLDLNNKSLINDFSFMCNTKKLCFYNEDISWENTLDTYQSLNQIDTFKSELNFKNSYINIVTESHYHFRENDVHITEKSFKPFYFFQLPIFVASWQHIKTMREEYDFDFFDDLIDHSYDDEKDDAKRFHMIVNEIKRLSTMRDEISTYYKMNMDKLIHNHTFLTNNNYDEKFKEYILNI